MKIGITLLVLLCTLSTISAKDILIHGDEVSYDHLQKVLSVSENVQLHYKNMEITSDHIHYEHGNHYLKIPGYVHVNAKNQTIFAKNIDYYTNTYNGKAHDLDAQFQRLSITGESILISPQKITIKNASFTTCDGGSDAHYQVYAKTIYVFPQFGYFIALHNTISISSLPFKLHVPTFFYGSKQYGLLGSSSLVPDFGTSKIEGFYIHEKLGYFRSEKSSGHVFLGHSSKLGSMGGVNHIFSPKPYEHINAKVYYVGNDGVEGRLAYHFNILEQKKSPHKDNFLDEVWAEFTQAGSWPLSSFSIIFQHREVINDIRVNYSPLFSFQTHEFPLTSSGLKMTLDTGFGKVAEETDDNNPSGEDATWLLQAWKSNLDLYLTQPLAQTSLYTLNSEIDYFGHWYDTGGAWNRLFGRLSLDFAVPLHPKISYTKAFEQNGESLFQYESAYQIDSDEIGLAIQDDYKRIFYKASSNYSLDNSTLRQLNLTLGMSFHCWKSSITWRAHNGAFNFGFEVH